MTADDGAGVDEDGDYVLTAENTHVTGITVGIYVDGTQVAAGTYGESGTITLTDYSAEDTAELTADSTNEKTLTSSSFTGTTATAEWEVTTDGGTYTAAEDESDFEKIKITDTSRGRAERKHLLCEI